MKNSSNNNFSGKNIKRYKKNSDSNFYSKDSNSSKKNNRFLSNSSKNRGLNNFNENEIDLIRRARNKTKRYPKSSDPTIYSRATGFETLIGWLFLKDPQRLSSLFEHLEIKIN